MPQIYENCGKSVRLLFLFYIIILGCRICKYGCYIVGTGSDSTVKSTHFSGRGADWWSQRDDSAGYWRSSGNGDNIWRYTALWRNACSASQT